MDITTARSDCEWSSFDKRIFFKPDKSIVYGSCRSSLFLSHPYTVCRAHTHTNATKECRSCWTKCRCCKRCHAHIQPQEHNLRLQCPFSADNILFYMSRLQRNSFSLALSFARPVSACLSVCVPLILLLNSCIFLVLYTHYLMCFCARTLTSARLRHSSHLA